MAEAKRTKASDLGSCRLASYLSDSIVDGPGLRLVLFTQGCPHRCRGCHNPSTHLNVGGYKQDLNELLAVYEANPLLEGITLSGGEPLLHAAALAPFAAAIRERDGDVILYSGFTLEQIRKMMRGESPGEKFSRMKMFKPDPEGIKALMGQTDILIDGPFVENKRNIDLLFRGSENQRLIPLTARGRTMLETSSADPSEIFNPEKNAFEA
mgnify:CR=1 FL=1